jgi:hypothetical protein
MSGFGELNRAVQIMWRIQLILFLFHFHWCTTKRSSTWIKVCTKFGATSNLPDCIKVEQWFLHYIQRMWASLYMSTLLYNMCTTVIYESFLIKVCTKFYVRTFFIELTDQKCMNFEMNMTWKNIWSLQTCMVLTYFRKFRREDSSKD